MINRAAVKLVPMRRAACLSPIASLFRPVLVLIGITCIALATGCSTGSNAVDQTAAGQFRFVSANKKGTLIPAAKRKAAPAFSGQLLNGHDAKLADYGGKVIALNFWAAWCSPCRVEAPDLEKVYQSEQKAGLQILGVDVKDDKGSAQEFISDKDITYPSFWDPQGRAALTFRNFNPNAIPSTILIDRLGRVAAVYMAPLIDNDLAVAVKPLLSER
jgi:peroxiredoxin